MIHYLRILDYALIHYFESGVHSNQIRMTIGKSQMRQIVM